MLLETNHAALNSSAFILSMGETSIVSGTVVEGKEINEKHRQGAEGGGTERRSTLMRRR